MQSKIAEKLILSSEEYSILRGRSTQQSSHPSTQKIRNILNNSITREFELSEPLKAVLGGAVHSDDLVIQDLIKTMAQTDWTKPADLRPLSAGVDATFMDDDNPAFYFLHMLASYLGVDAGSFPMEIFVLPIKDLVTFDTQNIPVTDPALQNDDPTGHAKGDYWTQVVVDDTWQFKFFQWATGYAGFYVETFWERAGTGTTYAGFSERFKDMGGGRTHIFRSIDINSTPIMSAIKKINTYARHNNDTIFTAFSNMPIGEALGLTAKNLKKLLPNKKDLASSVRGVRFKLDHVFATEGAYDSHLAKSVRPTHGYAIGSDHDTVVPDSDSLGGYQSDEARQEFVSAIYSTIQVVASELVFNNVFRGPNPLEDLRLCDLVPGKSNHPVNTPFINSFDKPTAQPIFGRALYERGKLDPWTGVHSKSKYRDTVQALTYATNQVKGLNGETTDWFHNTNYNPNVFYFPMPFNKNPSVAKAHSATRTLLTTMEKSNGENKFVNIVQSSAGAASMDNVLLYQESSITPFQSKLVNPDAIRDSYSFAKGKLFTDKKLNGIHLGDVAHNPIKSIKNNQQIVNEEYSFDIHGFYDADVLELINKIQYPGPAFEHKIQSPNELKYLAELNSTWGYGDSEADEDSNAILFGKLLTSKLVDLINEYAVDKDLDKHYLSRTLPYSFTNQAYSACRTAYSTKVFGKLRLSRLNHENFMKLLWTKILKSDTSPTSNKDCDSVFERLGKNNNDRAEPETDFFKISKIKPKIIDFFKKC